MQVNAANAAQARRAVIPPDMTDIPPEGLLAFLDTDCIDVVPGFNTRTHFDPAEEASFAKGVKEKGVLQAIVVRPQPGKDRAYYLIAGERRLRAARTVGLMSIPALIRNVTEAQAFVINAMENHDRVNLSPAEEADMVRRAVDASNGDRDEASKLLDMTRRTIDARLLLLQATPIVREALASRKIKLGIAELLCMLPAANQDATLTRVLETGISVDDLRAKISAYALNLSAAVFDTTGCRVCPNNSSRQASLFDVHIGEGRCGNHECYEKKRQDKLKSLKDDLLRTYNNVQLDSEKAPGTYTLLCKTGPHGVGREQYQACLGCANYGVLMACGRGEEGRVTQDTCFDVGCNKVKVVEYQKTLQEHAAPSETSVHSADTSKTGAAKSASGSQKPKTKPATSATPKRVEDIINRFYRNTAAIAVENHHRMGLVYAAYALINDVTAEAGDVLKQYGLSNKAFGYGNLHKGIDALAALDNDTIKKLIVEVTSVLVKSKAESGSGVHNGKSDIVLAAMNTLRLCQTDLSQHFRLDRAYLESNTKAGIESLMCECGFDKWFNGQKKDDKAFRRLMSEKNEKIIKDILGSGFTFSGFVPRQVQLTKS